MMENITVLKTKTVKLFKNIWSIIEDKKEHLVRCDVIEDKRGDTSFVSQGLWVYDGRTFTKVSQGGLWIIEEKRKKSGLLVGKS